MLTAKEIMEAAETEEHAEIKKEIMDCIDLYNGAIDTMDKMLNVQIVNHDRIDVWQNYIGKYEDFCRMAAGSGMPDIQEIHHLADVALKALQDIEEIFANYNIMDLFEEEYADPFEPMLAHVTKDEKNWNAILDASVRYDIVRPWGEKLLALHRDAVDRMTAWSEAIEEAGSAS